MSKPVKPKSEAPKLIDTYFNDVIKYTQQFGDRTAVYMQVGDFYEIYSAEMPDGSRIGVLDKISDICNLTISQKKVCLGLNFDAKVYMGGFPIYMLDKFINIPVDEHGWTVVVIKQDEQCAGTTRSLEGIYSPGTNMRTSEETNTLVLVVIEKVKSRINKHQSTLYIGMSSIDSITGNTVVYETFSIDQNTILSYDEIQKFISAKNPREVLIETSNKDLTEDDLVGALNLSGRPYRYNFIGCKPIEKNIDTQNKFFETIYQHKSKVSIIDEIGLQYKEYGRLSLMLLLKYILDHSTIMLNKINKPEVWEINTQLILANNSLEQLNIIDNRYSTKETALIKILDMTSTVLGRRAFRNRLLNPIRDPEILKTRYHEIKEMMDYDSNGVPQRAFYMNLESDLKNIRDLERLHRRIAMGTLSPMELSSLIISYKAIQNLYNSLFFKIKSSSSSSSSASKVKIKKNESKTNQTNPNEQMTLKLINNILPNDEVWNKFIKAFNFLDNTFDLDKTSFNNLEKVDKNFFKLGCDSKLDEHQNKIDHWNNIFKNFANWVDEMVSEKDLNRTVKKIAKFDYNDSFQHHIFLTKNRFDNLKKKIDEMVDNGCTEIELKIPTDSSETNFINYNINLKSISMEHKSRSSNNNDVVIVLENPDKKQMSDKKIKKSDDLQPDKEHYSLFTRLNYKLRNEMDTLKSTVISFYKETISNFSDEYINYLKEITEFIARVDVIKAGAKMAIEKSYIMPQIISKSELRMNSNSRDQENEDGQEVEGQDNSSFLEIKGIRHPIIEHINQKIPYVDNNLTLGLDNLDGILLFGVNASGKSSLMKAVGINLILAQAGFFVACGEFKYYPFDYLFTRIWNNDNIFKGQSTFEVEISELKSIIKHAGNKSLVLGDELCSGTETVSASAIVTAGIKKLSKTNAKFIFATHLHFLADSQHLITLDNVKNYHLSVVYDKVSGKLLYDRKLREGSGPSTYGLEVCKAMGLEDDFLEDAFNIRNEITNEHLGTFLNSKQSKYNQNVRITNCQVCNNHGEDVHHIQFQCTADNNGKIGSIHKNRESNLVVLCKKCHNSVHHPKGKLKINGYIETSTGIELDYEHIYSNI